MPGIITSSRISSGFSRAASSSALAPSLANSSYLREGARLLLSAIRQVRACARTAH